MAKPRKNPEADLPPYSEKAEATALGCILLAAHDEKHQGEVDALLHQLKPSLFYDVRHQKIFGAMSHVRQENHALSNLTLHQWLKDHRQLEDVGGMSYFMGLPDNAASIFEFGAALDIMRDKWLRRLLLQKQSRIGSLALEEGLTVEQVQKELADIHEHATKVGTRKAKIKIWRASELHKYEPPAHLRLVGDNEISMGYEGVALIAGPGSVGKSLALASLALAGAIGKGTWMGRAVHRPFTTLIIQAENGSSRLKQQLQAMEKAHPSLKKAIDEHIYYSAPPESGLAFHDPEFRRELRDMIGDIKPSHVGIDTWAQVAAEDGATETIEKLAEIRSVFPGGDDCPALTIVAHTSKPRPEQVRRGRALANLVSGSIALTNVARCVYMILPWVEDMDDDRVYWACPKLNNGQMYAPSVWKRRFGTFFQHDPETDASQWGLEEKKGFEEARVIKPGDVAKVFGELSVLKRSDFVKRLIANLGVSDKTIYAALKAGSDRAYLLDYVEVTKEGWIQKKEKQ